MSNPKLVANKVCGVLLLILVVGCAGSGSSTGPAPSASTPDLSDHPVYSTYDFGPDERTVDIGIQPLWVPTNVIAEAMKHDLVLENALLEHGLAIRFHSFLKGADVNFFLHRDDLEVAIGGDMPALTAVADSDAEIVSLIQYGFCSIVARRPMLMKELRGKRIAYAFGSMAHYALLQSLASDGLQGSDVRLVPLDVDEMPDALAQGTIDAFSAWEPTPTNAISRFGDQVIIHRSLCSGYLYFSRSFVDRYPEAVRQIVAAELRAISWMENSDQNLIQAIHWTLLTGQDLSDQQSVLSTTQYITLVKSDLLGTSSIPWIPEADLEAGGRLFREFEFLQGLGMISASSNWDRVSASFNHATIEEVLSRSKEYQLDTFDYANAEGEGDEQR